MKINVCLIVPNSYLIDDLEHILYTLYELVLYANTLYNILCAAEHINQSNSNAGVHKYQLDTCTGEFGTQLLHQNIIHASYSWLLEFQFGQ